MAPSDDDPSTPSATPVPPRGAKRKPNRPTSLSGRTPGSRAPAANRATGAEGGAKDTTGAGTGTSRSGATKAASGGPSKLASSGGPSARKASGGGANSPAARRRAALAQQRRKRQTLLAVGAIVVVIVVVAVFVIVKLTDNKTTNSSSVTPGKGGAASAGAGVGAPVPASVYTGFASVKPTALAAAANNVHPTDGAYPTVANDPPISTKGALPVIFYYGAEFCPFCATERWAMVLALSQFGTFKNLSSIASTPNDSTGIDSVPTFTFYKSTYTSKYLKFDPIETTTVDEKTLQSPSKAQTQIVVKYDSSQNIPFVYFNGKAILSGAEYNPDLLRHGTFLQDAQSIIAGTSSLATSVYFNAGAIVSEICRMTGGKGPAGVCKAFPKPITS